MTRDEAIKILSRVWGGNPQHDLANSYVDAFVALGMLNLEEPKGPNQRAIEAMFRVCEGGVLPPRVAMSVIKAAGLQIIEKGQ